MTLRLDAASFSVVLLNLDGGTRWSRADWEGPGNFISLQTPYVHGVMTKPYLYITTTDGHKVPWTPTQDDILANDWYTLR